MSIKSFWKFLMEKQLQAGKVAEDSILLRFLTYVIVVNSILAIYSKEFFGYLPILAIFLSAIGYTVSYLRRRKNNWILKTFLAFGMIIAGYISIKKMLYPDADKLIILSELMMWLLVLHSFDLPRRQDLFYSIVSALMLMSVGAALSRTMFFAPLLIIFALLSFVILIIFHYRELSADYKISGNVKNIYKLGLFVIFVSFFITSIFFVFLPRFQTVIIFTIPIPIRFPTPQNFRGEIQNPMVISKLGNTTGFLINFSFINSGRNSGFEPVLNLNQRSFVDNSIYMRVKSRHITYYRGLAFDKYLGNRWMLSDFEPEKMFRDKLSNKIYLKTKENTLDRNIFSSRIYQTFFIEKEMPNLVYVAYLPIELYFPAAAVYQDKENSIRSPIPLPEGTVYTAVSKVMIASQDILKTAHEEASLGSGNYVDISNVPLRVRRLAKKISFKYKTPYEKIQAISNYLKTNYRYNENIPPYPKGKDVVEYFLFNSKEGYCQHFASALAIMGRCVGVRTRLATGFSSGGYNQFTGYFEVRGRDAHAWVEAYIAPYGWISLDPTPNYDYEVNKAVYFPYDFVFKKAKLVSDVLITNVIRVFKSLTFHLNWRNLDDVKLNLIHLVIFFISVFILYRCLYNRVCILKTKTGILEKEENIIRKIMRRKGINTDKNMTLKEIFSSLREKNYYSYEYLLRFCDIFYKMKYDNYDIKKEDIKFIRSELKKIRSLI